jgi:hypothetical protein
MKKREERERKKTQNLNNLLQPENAREKERKKES